MAEVALVILQSVMGGHGVDRCGLKQASPISAFRAHTTQALASLSKSRFICKFLYEHWSLLGESL
jgi:hypothetical protein